MNSPRTRPFALAFALPLLFSAAAARAQNPDPAAPPADPATPPGETSAPPPADADGDEGGKKKKKKKNGDTDTDASGADQLPVPIEIKGRVFFRGTYSNYGEGLNRDGEPRTIQGLRLSVPSARFAFKVKPLDWATVNMELDIAGNPEMKDAYVQAKSKPFTVRAGQMKMPAVAIFMESPWTLPLVRRGMLNDILLDQLQISGRRPGAFFEWQGGGSLDPQIILGAFQGSQWNQDEFEYLSDRTFYGQNPIARLAITPGGVEIAAWGQMRSYPANSTLDDPQRFWAAGLDIVGDHTFGSSGLRYWIEAIAGQSWLDQIQDNSDFTQFRAGRALIAYRRGGVADGDGFVEPYVMFGAMDPDTVEEFTPPPTMPDAVRGSDLIWELKLGVNLGYWRKVRLTLEYERAEFGDFIPAYRTDPDDPNPFLDAQAFLLQAGAAF